MPLAARRSSRVRTGRRLGRAARATVLAAAAAAAFGSASAGAQTTGLRDLAVEAGVLVGTAVDDTVLATDAAYATLVVDNATTVSTIDELTMAVAQPQPGVFDFARADAVVDFAADNEMTVRGHDLIGHDSLPAWVTDGEWSADSLAALLQTHVTEVVGRYAERNPGVVTQWDVVEAAFLPDGSRRDSVWQRVIGDDYLSIAFAAASAADPDATLFYSDFFDDLAVTEDSVDNGVAIVPGATSERSTCDQVVKCVGVRDALVQLVGAGVPIDGVGIQAHLLSPDPYDLGRFAAWVPAIGLDWAVTEFDVPLPVTEVSNPDILAFQAGVYGDALSACVDDERCDTFVTWGITDRVSSVPAETGGAFGGALPFDVNDDPKPAAAAIADVLAAAPESAPTTTPSSTPPSSAVPEPVPSTVPAEGDGDDQDGAPIVAVVAAGTVVVLIAVAAIVRRRRAPRERSALEP
jgi:endo-1,4-beta-xylanase